MRISQQGDYRGATSQERHRLCLLHCGRLERNNHIQGWQSHQQSQPGCRGLVWAAVCLSAGRDCFASAMTQEVSGGLTAATRHHIDITDGEADALA